ncbi:hypothetical protein GGD62_008197 [Bradyrhizobium sp. ERR14]|nr:hypothetical protein [Bradyrhizobium sp. ERR14]
MYARSDFLCLLRPGVEFHAIEYAQHFLSLLGMKRRDLAICQAQRLIGRPGLIGCKHRKRLRPQ